MALGASALCRSWRSRAKCRHASRPDRSGAHTRALSSDWYRHWKVCVWMALKVSVPGNSPARFFSPRAATVRGCRSSSSVGGWTLEGRMRWRKDTGSVVSQFSQSSDTARTKYCGGIGSKTGTQNRNRNRWPICHFFRVNMSLASMVVDSLSSTSSQNRCCPPCTASSQAKSGCTVTCRCSCAREAGWMLAASSRLGNWCTRACSALPRRGFRATSPISWGDMS
mmetsp:Transcript_10689/g.30011  ORF Transcript_10689/g.30011 Transcript_10689/m.30011 type:complete len:224 (+) Transcript_10689:2503-3174(+)